MAISVVSKRRRLRGFGRGSGKHALPENLVPEQRSPAGDGVQAKRRAYQGLHKAKASGPRLSGPYEKRAA
jgi:hypothetical protein